MSTMFKYYSQKGASMKVILAELHGKPVELELRDGIVYIDGEAEPIKNLEESELLDFQKELEALPEHDIQAHQALVNSVRAAFLAKLLGKAVGDETVNRLTHILDHVHYDVLQYLGEAE